MKEIIFYFDTDIAAEADWRQRASCATIVDPDVFFPIGTTGQALDQIEAAKAICSTCVVKQECLDWALATHQETGVWGGLSEDERRALRRQPAYA